MQSIENDKVLRVTTYLHSLIEQCKADLDVCPTSCDVSRAVRSSIVRGVGTCLGEMDASRAIARYGWGGLGWK